MKGKSVATVIIVVAAVVGFCVHVVAQSTLTLEQKRALYTISPEVKECIVNRMNELMERVKVAKTDAELERYRVLLDPDEVKKACTAKVAASALQANKAQGVPLLTRFKVTGEDSTARVIVVDATTSEAQMIALVNSFRVARAAGTLGQLVTPTTPKAPKGPYQVVWVLVMSDPQWATSQRAHQFFNQTGQSPTAFEKEYGKRVRASYYYSAPASQEYGTIGFSDQDSGFTSANYKKLF